MNFTPVFLDSQSNQIHSLGSLYVIVGVCGDNWTIVSVQI